MAQLVVLQLFPSCVRLLKIGLYFTPYLKERRKEIEEGWVQRIPSPNRAADCLSALLSGFEVARTDLKKHLPLRGRQ
jgi:hypothetical protein